MLKTAITLSFITIFFSSCISMAPNLELNNKDIVPNEFKEYESLSTSDTKLTLDEYIKDEKLKRVVTIALENNKNIKIALLNIEASKSMYKIEEAKYFPSLDANGDFTREKKDSTIKNSYKASIGTVFELDLFGKIRSLNDSAENSFLATKYALNSTKLALISQSINSYLSLASNIENLNLSKKILKNLEDVYSLTNKKYLAGVISKEEVLSSLAMLKESQNELLKYENLVQIDINSLELLLASKLPKELIPSDFKKDESYLTLVKVGIKSDILLNRPDIMELEYKLRAKNADIGAARAAFFPSISLTASTGFASTGLSNLFNNQNSFWQFSPNISIPIFSGGENMAMLDYSHTQKQIALNEYEKGIQTAFKEVNDALIVRKNIFDKLENQKELTSSLEQTYNIALSSYKIGYGSYLNMLIAQKAYINSQKNLISVYLEELENRVELYKTMGGDI